MNYMQASKEYLHYSKTWLIKGLLMNHKFFSDYHIIFTIEEKIYEMSVIGVIDILSLFSIFIYSTYSYLLVM